REKSVMSNRKAKAAVIGVGLRGEQHAEAYANNPRAELVMVHDLNAERAKAVGERFGVPYTSDMADIANSDAAIVSVATPDHAPRSQPMAIVQAGKDVVRQKPLATIAAEAKQLVELANAKNLKLAVNLGNRFNATYNNVRDSVRPGEIGDPVFADFRVSDTI